MSHMMSAVLNTRQHASQVAKQSSPGITLHRHAPSVVQEVRRELETFGRTLAVQSQLWSWHTTDKWSSVTSSAFIGSSLSSDLYRLRNTFSSSRDQRSTSQTED